VIPRIILVEDNESDEKLTRLAFRGCAVAHELTVLRDGQLALEHLLGDECQRNPPALILLDIKLPRIDGFETLRVLRAHAATAALPIVMLSASAQHDDVVQSYGLGANAYVQKPIDFAEFTRAVRALGEFWLCWNQLPRALARP
jgi:two-component system, response regulator